MKRILPIGLFLAAGAVSALASVDSGLIALIPANSKLIAGIDVVKCRTSEFGQYLLSKSQADDVHFEQFMTQTGFDPRRDLDSLVMASSSESSERNSPFAILARGTFDQAKITSLAVSKGAVAQTYMGVNLLVSKDHGQPVAFAFPDAGVAVMGDLDSIHQVIRNLTVPSSLDVDVTNRIDAAGSANDAWFVSATGGAALGKHLSAEMGTQVNGQGQALQSIRAANGGVKFGSVVAISVDASTRSEQDAASLSDVFRFLSSMIQMSGSRDPRTAIMAASLQNMQLRTQGDTVHVGFSMSEKNLEQMADMEPRKQ
jgi:hypothetical protein